MNSKEAIRIPFLDLRPQYEAIKDQFGVALGEILDNTSFILSRQVSDFEERFAEFCSVEFCVGVNSGTDALILSLRALGIGPGDEVLIPVNTFIATAEAVSLVGATPVFVDVLDSTKCIDPQLAADAVTGSTKAIIPVHLFGNPAPMEEILQLAEERDLAVVEDAAQAHGAHYRDRIVGCLGNVSAFSFYPGKNLGAFGDAGAVVTDDRNIYEEVLRLRNHGGLRKYEHAVVGYNSRLDSIQAVVLSLKLPFLNEWNARRRRNAQLYRSLLEEVEWLAIPAETEKSEPVYHLLTAEIVNDSIDRDALLNHLERNGIGFGIHYPDPLHLTGAYSGLGYGGGEFPVSEKTMRSHFSLPMFAELTEEMIERVVEILQRFPSEDREDQAK